MTILYTKIAALKIAAANLLHKLNSSRPGQHLVRTGAVSYNNAMQTPTRAGLGHRGVTKTYVNALTATGGTDSSAAFKTATSLQWRQRRRGHEAKTARTGQERPGTRRNTSSS